MEHSCVQKNNFPDQKLICEYSDVLQLELRSPQIHSQPVRNTAFIMQACIMLNCASVNCNSILFLYVILLGFFHSRFAEGDLHDWQGDRRHNPAPLSAHP